MNHLTKKLSYCGGITTKPCKQNKTLKYHKTSITTPPPAVKFRVEFSGYPTNPPTDPYVKVSLIRFLSNQSFDTTLTHNFAALQALYPLLNTPSDALDDPGSRQRPFCQEFLELLPWDVAIRTPSAQPVLPCLLLIFIHNLHHPTVTSDTIVPIVALQFLA